MPRVILRPAAENDLLEQAEYYDLKGGDALGDRFLAACETGFSRLSAFPESGTVTRLRHPRIRDIRFILVPGFEEIVIFYDRSEDRVRIIRVLHGRRDMEAVFAGEIDEDTPDGLADVAQ